MKSNLDEVIQALRDTHSTATGMLHSVHMMLEQHPCMDCVEKRIIPAMVEQLPTRLRAIPLKLVTMLPYSPGSVFSQRLTEVRGPVQLKDALCPFDERHACMVNKRCEHVRCHQHCQYSKPSKVLTVDVGTLRPYN